MQSRLSGPRAPKVQARIRYSFFSAGVVVGVGVGVVRSGVAVGIVTAAGAACQWPCSADHTCPAGTGPGGWGAGVNCGWDVGVGTGRDCAGGVIPKLGAGVGVVATAGFGAASGGLAKK
jgi:hypothetical protein